MTTIQLRPLIIFFQSSQISHQPHFISIWIDWITRCSVHIIIGLHWVAIRKIQSATKCKIHIISSGKSICKYLTLNIVKRNFIVKSLLYLSKYKKKHVWPCRVGVVAFGFVLKGWRNANSFSNLLLPPGLSATAMKAWGAVAKEIKLLNSNLTFPKTPSAAIWSLWLICCSLHQFHFISKICGDINEWQIYEAKKRIEANILKLILSSLLCFSYLKLWDLSS